MRGEAAGGNESDFGEDGEVDICHHKKGLPCNCVYDESVPAKWSVSPWQNSVHCQVSCRVKHDSIVEGYQAVPSSSRVIKLKQLQREKKANEQQGRSFYQDQAPLEAEVRDLQQQLHAKERDYTLANNMVEELEARLAIANEEIANARTSVYDLMERIEAQIPQDFLLLGLYEQLEIYKTELEMVIMNEDDYVENSGNSSRRVSINLPQRSQTREKVTISCNPRLKPLNAILEFVHESQLQSDIINTVYGSIWYYSRNNKLICIEIYNCYGLSLHPKVC